MVCVEDHHVFWECMLSLYDSPGLHLLFPIGFLQLAGGTNAHTVDGLKKEGLFQTTSVPSTSLSCSFHLSFCSLLALYHFPILIISFFRELKGWNTDAQFTLLGSSFNWWGCLSWICSQGQSSSFLNYQCNILNRIVVIVISHIEWRKKNPDSIHV